MTQTPAGPGWYDDPDDPTLLRYFDGVIWTAHTTQRHSPTADASTIGRAPDVPAADARVGWPQQAPTQPGSGQWPGQGQWTGGQAPGGRQGGAYGPAWGAPRGVLPDGAVLAEWWRRLVARILDTVVAGLITLVVAIPWWGDVLAVLSEALDEISTSAASGAAVDSTRFAEDLTAALVPVTLVNIVVMLVYEVGFLTWRSATPGKMVLGTVVRRAEGRGPIGFVTAVRRQLITVVTALLAFLPVVNVLASILNILDPAWLLWDPRRQTLHDKVADTVVVLKRPEARAWA